MWRCKDCVLKFHGPQSISGASLQKQRGNILLSNWGRWGLKTQKRKHKIASCSPDIPSWFEKRRKDIIYTLDAWQSSCREDFGLTKGSKCCLVKSIWDLDPLFDTWHFLFQLVRRMLHCCCALTLQKCFVNYETSSDIPSWVRQDNNLNFMFNKMGPFLSPTKCFLNLNLTLSTAPPHNTEH